MLHPNGPSICLGFPLRDFVTLLFADKRQHFCNQCLIKPTNGFDLAVS